MLCEKNEGALCPGSLFFKEGNLISCLSLDPPDIDPSGVISITEEDSGV